MVMLGSKVGSDIFFLGGNMSKVEHFRQQLMAAINADGERAFYLSQNKDLGNVTKVISTQAPSVDRIISHDMDGNWGIPCGRTSFIVGDPSTGKTTICLHICAEAQQRGGIAYYIDGEHRLDEPYAERIGVDVDSLIISKPTTLEEGLEEIHSAIKHISDMIDGYVKKANLKDKKKSEAARKSLEAIRKIPIAIVMDSVSIQTEAELGGSKEKGGHARAVSEALRKIIPDVGRLNIAVVFVCQKKSKINIGWGSYGPQETMLAESALRFQCTIGLKTIKTKSLKGGSDGDNNIGDTVKLICVKNSCIPPFQTGFIEIYYGKGIDYFVSLCDALVKFYGAKKTKQTYKLKSVGVEWTYKNGLRKLFKKDPRAARKIRKLLAEPTEDKVRV
jgi:recombination protein RecA